MDLKVLVGAVVATVFTALVATYSRAALWYALTFSASMTL
jgi:hypothetical protein